MTTAQHSTLTGSSLHESKGVASAAINKVYVTDGAGSGTWQKLTASQLTGTGNSFGGQLLHVREEQASGTNGGTFTSGSWVTRVINTTKTNEISSASLASNQITLPAGTYYLEATAPAYNVQESILKLYNVTDSNDILIGTSASSNTAVTSQVSVKGRFTLAGTKILELRHRCNSTTSTFGLGVAANMSVVEAYAEILIWKIL